MIIIGDVHGEFYLIMEHLRKYGITNTNLIQVGDFGLGFDGVMLDILMLRRIDKFMKKRKNKLYILRGNHDKKWYWDNREHWELKNVILVQDYEIYTIEGKEVLFVGGAISIDRQDRKENIDYWSDERIYLNNNFRWNNFAKRVDIVISHDSPQSTWPYTVSADVARWFDRDKCSGGFLIEDVHLSRMILKGIMKAATAAGCKEWYFGHHHQSHQEEVEGIKFRCLNINEMYERRPENQKGEI